MTYHLVGIKGSGMSGLAQILFDMHFDVSGSDVDKRFFTQQALEERGIPMYPFDADNIKEGQTVIASSAYPDDHVEIKKARALGLPVYRYHQFIGMFARGFKSLAVTGSHGKTSTTGLLAHVLDAAEPTSFLIGDGSGKGKKDSRFFVFEACEYRRHFLAYEPEYLIITNIDFDHPDYFRDTDDVFSAFQELARQVRRKIIACGDDPLVKKLEAPVPISYYGLNEGNDIRAVHIASHDEGTTFEVWWHGTYEDTVTIPGYGNHNVVNTLAVIAAASEQGLTFDMVKARLQAFSGVQRRFSESRVGNQVLIDDYAHHPVEITATIEAAEAKYPERDIVAVFQPHTFTRTETFLNEFALSLQKADSVYLCNIFSSARERQGALTIKDLQARIPGSQLITEDDTGRLAEHDSAVLLFMGAGDIQKFENAYKSSMISS